MDKVSVVIPMHNSEKFIVECLNSVVNQTYTNLEIIIIDDCSTDDSINLVKSFSDKRIKLIKLKENKGVSYARNKGVKLSTGKFLCFLDSDDYWSLDKVEKQIKFIKSNNYSFIYSGYMITSPRRQKVVSVPDKLDYNSAIKNTTIFTSTVMFNMNDIKKDDLYMNDIKIGQDTLCWWGILKKGITAYGINESLSIYRVGSVSLSSNKIKAVCGAWKIYRKQELGFIKMFYSFCCYIFNAIKRRI